jgi:hypothetical protein
MKKSILVKKVIAKLNEHKITPSLRNKITKDLQLVGFDGNIKFEKPDFAVQKAVAVLNKYGIEVDDVFNAQIFMNPKNSKIFRLAWTNDLDTSSPIPITNIGLNLSWENLDRVKGPTWEFIAYLT